MTYLTGVAQDWFEVGIIQDWLSDWNLFVDKLRRHFGLSDPIGEAANMLDNLRMKPSDKISTYNVDFMRYASQLGWGNSVLCHRYYQGLPVVATTRHSRTNDLTTSKALQWAIK